MPDFTLTTTRKRPYLYQERHCSMDPADISRAMGDCFANVWAFLQAQGIKPTGAPIAVYHTFDPHSLTFRAGYPVSAKNARKAAGSIQADTLPATRALTFTHVGPYSTLRNDYQQMMGHMQTQGLTLAAPTWEVNVDDPATTPPDQLRTEVYSAIA